MIKPNPYKKLKKCVDILSILCVAAFLVIPWVQFIDLLQTGVHDLHHPQQWNLPLLILYTMDFLPFLFGLGWLFPRYEMMANDRYPFFTNCRLHEISILIVALVPHMLISMV